MQKVKIKFYPLDDTLPVKLGFDNYVKLMQYQMIRAYLGECGFVQDKNCNIENLTYTVEKNSIKHFWTIFPRDEIKYCNFSFELIG